MQHLLLNYQIDNGAIFSAPPVLDAAGRLTFSPAPNTSGTATVKVWVSDDGGTVRGGGDVIFKTFSITVQKTHPGYNAGNAADVDGNGLVTPIDALTIINFLNAQSNDNSGLLTSSGGYYMDVNADGYISPIDGLLVINRLNSHGTVSQGEPDLEKGMLDLLANDFAIQSQRRRR
jgi:hypothetical protein